MNVLLGTITIGIVVFIVALAITGSMNPVNAVSSHVNTPASENILAVGPTCPSKCFDCERDDIIGGFQPYTQRTKCFSC